MCVAKNCLEKKKALILRQNEKKLKQLNIKNANKEDITKVYNGVVYVKRNNTGTTD